MVSAQRSNIDELKRLVTTDDVRVSQLLKLALAVSYEVDDIAFRSTIEKELRGYIDGDVVPSYRVLPCAIQAAHQFVEDWTDVIYKSDPAGVNRVPWPFGIEVVEKMVDGMTPDEFQYDILVGQAHETFRRACKGETAGVRFRRLVGRTELLTLLNSVRYELLTWSLQIKTESSAALLTQPKVLSTAHTVSNTFNFNGPATANIQQANSNAYQTGSQLDIDSVKAFVDSVRELQASLSLRSDAEKDLSAQLATIDAQLDSTRPNSVIVSEGGKSIRNILEGVLSNGLANTVLPQLPNIIGAAARLFGA